MTQTHAAIKGMSDTARKLSNQMYLNAIKARRRRLDRAKEQMALQQQLFDDTILDARDAGLSLREIEKVAGITNVSVMNAEARARKRQTTA